MKFLFFAAALLAPPAVLAAPAAEVTSCDAEWRDAARDRLVPVRIRMPAGTGKAPGILFSHGLGGSLGGGTNWAEAWAKAGFVVVNPCQRRAVNTRPKSCHGILAAAGEILSPYLPTEQLAPSSQAGV